MESLLISTDAELVQEFKSGSNKALEFLIRRHKEKVYTSILFLVKDRHLAEDLFQDAFIKIIDTIRSGSYTEEGKFLSFAIRVAHNICVDHFRKVKRVQIIHAGDNSEFFEAFYSSESAADENMIQLQTSDRVKKLLDMLPEDQREVIVLRHFANLSFKEIAQIMNCGISTALGRMRYALTNLRVILEEKDIVF